MAMAEGLAVAAVAQWVAVAELAKDADGGWWWWQRRLTTVAMAEEADKAGSGRGAQKNGS